MTDWDYLVTILTSAFIGAAIAFIVAGILVAREGRKR